MENKFIEEEKALTNRVFPALTKGRNAQDTIRIWCPACGTGEAAFLLVINLLEYLHAKKKSIPIQVFATDTDEGALKKARSGLYTPDELHPISSQQLNHFFVKVGKQYRVVNEIRDVCIFATHNVLTDPPFPRLDIISFQPSLLTMATEQQQKVLSAFHFGLKTEGFLLLHPAEAMPDNPYFDLLAEKVYTRNARTIKSIDSAKHGLLKPSFAKAEPASWPPPKKDAFSSTEVLTSIDITSEKLLLSRYVPASLVMDSQFTILRFYGPVQKYLQPTAGKAALDALSMLPEELAAGLQELVNQVAQNTRVVQQKDVTLYDGEKEATVTIEVAHLQATSRETHYLIIFKDKETFAAAEMADGNGHPARRAKKEAPPAKAGYEILAEEYKSSREEWQAAHEELTANYEEALQTNQELKKNKEELQAAVKELMVANEDLEAQNISLSETADLSINILEAIRNPMVLLNTNLSVHTANKTFYSTFRLTPSDVEGRFMYEIGDSQWNVPELLSKLSEVVSKKNGYATFELPFAESQMLLYNAVHIENGSKRSDRILISVQDVTQHRLARDAKEWLAAVVESSNEGIVSFTTNKTIISWNKGAEEIFGYTEAEMVGKSITRLVKQSDKLAQHKLIERVMKGDVVRQLEMEDMHKDGRIIHVSTSISLIKDQKGNIKGMMASVQDITERKMAVEALRESEERFRPIVSDSAVGIARADFNGRLLFVNQKFCDMMGFSSDEILEKTVWDINFNNQIDGTRHRFLRLQEEGVPFEYEKQLLRKDNTPLWVSINLSAIKDQNGVPYSLTAVVMDINQRKEAEEALQQAKDSLQMAQEAANMGSWEMDLVNGRIIYHNLRNDQLMGYGVWQPDWNLTIARQNVIEEDKHLFDEAITQMMSTGRLHMEVRVRWPDGSIHWIYKAGQISYDEYGKPIRAAGIGMDTTNLKMAEQQKEILLGIASHELKTPVTSIKAYAQILQERFVEAEDYHSASLITKLDRQVDKLTELIKDLLDTTRITEGQLLLKQEIFDLNCLIREVAEDLQTGHKSHKIVKKLHPLPTIQADKERLRQVLVNLITNAIKYSPQSNKVIICTESDGKQLIVRVQDYGIGIPQHLQQQVFERFFRATNVRDAATPNLGLGLFISSQIIRQHKGTIWVQSEEGAGATFAFSLPANDSGE